MKNNIFLNAAFDAVSQACQVTNEIQADLERIRQLEKNDKSPVTVADFAAQAVVVHVLQQRLGEIRMVGEENSAELRQSEHTNLCSAVLAAVHHVWPEATKEEVLNAIDLGNHDASAEQFWTLDPVDGTKGFLRGGQFAISLALIENGKVKLGVLGCPNLSSEFNQGFDQTDAEGLIYFAVEGEGTWVVSSSQPISHAIKLKVGASDGLIRVCESVEAGHSKHDDTARIVAALGGAGESVRLDSQCKYAVVARGQADAYLRLPTRADYVEKIWDHAAGMLIAQEAGMIVTDIFGKSLDFTQGAGLKNNRGVICANPRFHHQIIDAIKTLDLT